MINTNSMSTINSYKNLHNILSEGEQNSVCGFTSDPASEAP